MREDVLRGRIFEIFVLKLVINSGYHLFEEKDEQRMKNERFFFLEYKGRGGFHQIDIPVDSDFSPEFMYPIRLLGEVKFYKKPVEKSTIRERIGVMMDIQQNYTDADYSNEYQRKNKKTEVFAIFSASGFVDSAEKLAFSHNIKTISFDKNPDLVTIKEYADKYAKHFANAENDEQNRFLKELFNYLILNNYDRKSLYKKEELTFSLDSNEIDRCNESIVTTLIGTTSTGLTMFFTSREGFPFDDVFSEKDSELCEIHNDNDAWYLKVKGTNAKLYFSMPEMVLNSKFEKNGEYYYPEKQMVFENIHFKRMIHGIERNITFKFDDKWFNRFLK